jgi:hypothetical protein
MLLVAAGFMAPKATVEAIEALEDKAQSAATRIRMARAGGQRPATGPRGAMAYVLVLLTLFPKRV